MAAKRKESTVCGPCQECFHVLDNFASRPALAPHGTGAASGGLSQAPSFATGLAFAAVRRKALESIEANATVVLDPF